MPSSRGGRRLGHECFFRVSREPAALAGAFRIGAFDGGPSVRSGFIEQGVVDVIIAAVIRIVELVATWIG
jgi:hypothetical protein